MRTIIYFLVTLFISTIALAHGPSFQKIFKDKNACFVLYDLKTNKVVVDYNRTRCQERVFACSTFKIPIALMAFDQGILRDENTIIKWDGVDRGFSSWNKDQTPKTWLQNSTVWVSQWITPQIGMDKIKKYLAEFSYGNQDMSGGITKAWLSSSLKISAYEQINFLKNLWQEKLSVSKQAITLTKNSLYKEISPRGAIMYGKTGSGFIDDWEDPSSRMLGWYVGYLISSGHQYAFATNVADLNRNTSKTFIAKALSSGETAKAFTKEILHEMRLY